MREENFFAFIAPPLWRRGCAWYNIPPEILVEKNLLTIYPSGAMYTQHQQVIQFQGGTDRILKGEKKNLSIVFAVFLVDYFGFARPEIRIYIENYSGEHSTETLTIAYNSFYKRCVEKQTE